MSGSLIRYLRYSVYGETDHQRAPRRHRSGRGPIRDWRCLAWIRTLPSAVSGQLGCEAAHTGSDGGMQQKPSDYSAIPLTPAEHREYHQVGRDAFEARHGIDCQAIAKRLKHDWFAYSSEVK